MTEEEQQRVWQEFMRAAQQRQAEEIAAQQIIRVQAARRAAERQQDMDTWPRRKYAVIVAVDAHGGFSKNGEMPWHYPADLKWFKKRTSGQLCIMGRKTYETIHKGTEPAGGMVENSVVTSEPGGPSVLPGRKCFVCSSTLEKLDNARVVKDLAGFEHHLTEEDDDKTAFIIGGEKLFNEGISLAQYVYLTIIDKDFQCDKFFPVKYLQDHFILDKMLKNAGAPELRWQIWSRKVGV